MRVARPLLYLPQHDGAGVHTGPDHLKGETVKGDTLKAKIGHWIRRRLTEWKHIEPRRRLPDGQLYPLPPVGGRACW